MQAQQLKKVVQVGRQTAATANNSVFYANGLSDLLVHQDLAEPERQYRVLRMVCGLAKDCTGKGLKLVYKEAARDWAWALCIALYQAAKHKLCEYTRYVALSKFCFLASVRSDSVQALCEATPAGVYYKEVIFSYSN